MLEEVGWKPVFGDDSLFKIQDVTPLYSTAHTAIVVNGSRVLLLTRA